MSGGSQRLFHFSFQGGLGEKLKSAGAHRLITPMPLVSFGDSIAIDTDQILSIVMHEDGWLATFRGGHKVILKGTPGREISRWLEGKHIPNTLVTMDPH